MHIIEFSGLVVIIGYNPETGAVSDRVCWHVAGEPYREPRSMNDRSGWWSPPSGRWYGPLQRVINAGDRLLLVYPHHIWEMHYIGEPMMFEFSVPIGLEIRIGCHEEREDGCRNNKSASGGMTASVQQEQQETAG